MNCFIFTGEKSGEQHGAHLIAALEKKIPNLKVTGVFGENIKNLGHTQHSQHMQLVTTL